MLNVESKLKSIDNSGISFVKCIKIFGSGNKKFAVLGDFIKVSFLKKNLNRKKLGSFVNKLFYAIIVSCRKKTSRFSLGGICIRSDSNSVVLLDLNYKLLGSKIKGSVSYECKKGVVRNFLCTVDLSKFINFYV